MATRRKPDETLIDKSGEVIESADFALTLDAEEESRESDEQALLNVLEQLGGDADGAKVMVYRITDDKRKPDAFLRRFSPAEFACDGLETLLRLYGGGLYKISVYGSNGRLIKNPTISIEAPAGYKPEGEKQEEKPQTDIASQVTQSIVGALGPVLQQIGQVISQPRDNRADFLAEMVQMKSLFERPDTGAGMGMMQMFELFKSGIEFGKESGPKGESNENDVLMGLMEKFGGPIMEAVMTGNKQAGQNQPPQQPNVPPIPQIPQGNPAVPVQPVIPQPEMTEEEKMLFGAKQSINFLCSQASRNADVETYAFLVMDQLDDEMLTNLLDSPDWFENLSKLSERVKDHRMWFEALRERIRQILTEEGESADTDSSTVEPGNQDAAKRTAQ